MFMKNLELNMMKNIYLKSECAGYAVLTIGYDLVCPRGQIRADALDVHD